MALTLWPTMGKRTVLQALELHVRSGMPPLREELKQPASAFLGRLCERRSECLLHDFVLERPQHPGRCPLGLREHFRGCPRLQTRSQASQALHRPPDRWCVSPLVALKDQQGTDAPPL